MATKKAKSIKGIYLWYSGHQTHNGYVKSVRKIADDNVKVSFSDGETKESFLTVSFTESQIKKLLENKKVLNDNDGKYYQVYDAWKKSLAKK